MIREIAKRVLPKRMRRRTLRRYRRITAWPPIGAVRLGSLRRTTPISSSFGFDRGQPIDRYYIEDFIRRYGQAAGVIRGRVLEIQDDMYAQRFGDGIGVEQIDVLDIEPSNPNATIVADLAGTPDLPPNLFDCIICTQTLQLIYDLQAAVLSLHQMLKPGGAALVTIPGIAQIFHPSGELSYDCWRVTVRSAKRLFEMVFPTENVTVEVYGNVLSATAFLYGLATEELTPSELDVRDPDYPLIIGVKATKAPRPPFTSSDQA